MAYIYNEKAFKTLELAKLALISDFPDATEEELPDLFDMYIEED